MTFWVTPAGRAAILAARAKLRRDRLRGSLGVILNQQNAIYSARIEELRALLLAEEIRPSEDDIDQAAHIGLSERQTVSQDEAERAVAVAIVLAQDAESSAS